MAREKVTVYHDDLDRLESDREKLEAIEAGGADNWEGYSDLLKDWYKRYVGD